MGRTKKKIDVELFRRVIDEIDSPDLSNKTILYNMVAEKYNKIVTVDFPDITMSVVTLRIKELGIPLKTPTGTKGRPKGSKIPAGTARNRTSRADKFASNSKSREWFETLEKACPEKTTWIEKIKGGSLKYALKYYCYTCSGFSASDALQCKDLSCPFLLFLPRK